LAEYKTNIIHSISRVSYTHTNTQAALFNCKVSSTCMKHIYTLIPHLFLLIDSNEALLWISWWLRILSWSPFHRFKLM